MQRHDADFLHKLKTWDKEYVWHPFTPMQDYARSEPLIISGGRGSYLIDIEGNRYLDGISSLWVNVHGHVHPVLNEALIKQINRVAHSTLLGLANVPSIKLAKKLVEITPPGLNKVFYSDAGSTAVEIALKIAFQYWQQKDAGQYRQKTKFISLVEGYHGDTLGSVSVGGMDLFHRIFSPLIFDGFHVPTPYCYRCHFGLNPHTCKRECLQHLEAIMEKHHSEIAAMIIEPLVQGAAGMIVAPSGYLRRVRELCNKYQILMIADEVAVGFGRTGRLFACEHEQVAPDLMCVAKGLTGGYLPVAATLTTEEVYNAFLGEPWENKTFFHGHTYTGNPLGCAVALANLNLIEDNDLIGRLQAKITLLEKGLAKFYELAHVGEVRQKGLMVGIELVKEKETRQAFAPSERIAHRVILEARRRGLILRPLGDVLVLMPILAMKLDELDQVLSITYAAIKTVTEGGRGGAA